MKFVFADTGYWVAVLNPKDDWNTRAIAVSRSLDKVRIVTTEMILTELLAALSKLPIRPIAVQGVERIRTNPNIEVVPQTSLQFGEAFATYKRMVDKEWSLVDCASFEVMQSRGISEALAHDHHFSRPAFAPFFGKTRIHESCHAYPRSLQLL